jgi:hypothetical protein
MNVRVLKVVKAQIGQCIVRMKKDLRSNIDTLVGSIQVDRSAEKVHSSRNRTISTGLIERKPANVSATPRTKRVHNMHIQ